MASVDNLHGEVKTTKPADPDKLKKYQLSKEKIVEPPKIKVDKMGRRKRTHNGMSLETARYITDLRIGRMLHNRFKDE